MPRKQRATKRTNQLAAFHDAVQSLKLYRRAELPGSEEDSSLIEKLYVDPLPHEQIFWRKLFRRLRNSVLILLL